MAHLQLAVFLFQLPSKTFRNLQFFTSIRLAAEEFLRSAGQNRGLVSPRMWLAHTWVHHRQQKEICWTRKKLFHRWRRWVPRTQATVSTAWGQAAAIQSSSPARRSHKATVFTSKYSTPTRSQTDQTVPFLKKSPWARWHRPFEETSSHRI